MEDFVVHLSKQDIETYYRNNKLTGVRYGGRKYRLKRTLGINVDALQLQDKILQREEELRVLKKQLPGPDLQR